MLFRSEPKIKFVTDKNNLTEGGLYFYAYDAKYKDKHPKWDSFPMTIILKKTKTGFLGLNLHYLPINQRSVLLGRMLQSNSIYDKRKDKLKLTITYDLLKSSSAFRGYEKCVKEYLFTNIQSKILPLDPHEWLYAIILPLENFHYKK